MIPISSGCDVRWRFPKRDSLCCNLLVMKRTFRSAGKSGEFCDWEKPSRRPLVIKNLADSSIVLGQLVRGRREGSARTLSLRRWRVRSISSQVREACRNCVEYDHRIPLRLPYLSGLREPGEELGEYLNENGGDLVLRPPTQVAKR